MKFCEPSRLRLRGMYNVNKQTRTKWGRKHSVSSIKTIKFCEPGRLRLKGMYNVNKQTRTNWGRKSSSSIDWKPWSFVGTVKKMWEKVARIAWYEVYAATEYSGTWYDTIQKKWQSMFFVSSRSELTDGVAGTGSGWGCCSTMTGWQRIPQHLCDTTQVKAVFVTWMAWRGGRGSCCCCVFAPTKIYYCSCYRLLLLLSYYCCTLLTRTRNRQLFYASSRICAYRYHRLWIFLNQITQLFNWRWLTTGYSSTSYYNNSTWNLVPPDILFNQLRNFKPILSRFIIKVKPHLLQLNWIVCVVSLGYSSAPS